MMWADFLTHFQDEMREDGPAQHEGEIDAPADETQDDQALMSNTSGMNMISKNNHEESKELTDGASGGSK